MCKAGNKVAAMLQAEIDTVLIDIVCISVHTNNILVFFAAYTQREVKSRGWPRQCMQ